MSDGMEKRSWREREERSTGDGHAISIPPHKVIKLKHVPLEQPQIPVELSSTQMRVKFSLLFLRYMSGSGPDLAQNQNKRTQNLPE